MLRQSGRVAPADSQRAMTTFDVEGGFDVAVFDLAEAFLLAAHNRGAMVRDLSEARLPLVRISATRREESAYYVCDLSATGISKRRRQ
jgi:hypothetical protein